MDRVNGNDAQVGVRMEQGATEIVGGNAFYVAAETIGYHYLAWLEYSTTETDTTTWYGEHGTAEIYSGLMAGRMS